MCGCMSPGQPQESLAAKTARTVQPKAAVLPGVMPMQTVVVAMQEILAMMAQQMANVAQPMTMALQQMLVVLELVWLTTQSLAHRFLVDPQAAMASTGMAASVSPGLEATG